MVGFQFVALMLCASSAVASPRIHLNSEIKRDAFLGGDFGPSGNPRYGSWGPGPDGPSSYDGTWSQHSTPSSSYGGGGDGWGHSSTCAASTIVQTVFSTVSGPASTVFVSGSGETSVPASTYTVSGPPHTTILTSYETITQPAAPETIYITKSGWGWNQTATQGETDLMTTTDYEYSTIYNGKTAVITSVVTLPGTLAAQFCRLVIHLTFYRRDIHDLRDFFRRHHGHFYLYSPR